MPDDLLQVLTRFHREVIVPDLDRRDERLGIVEQKLDEVLSHLDGIYLRFDRLETRGQQKPLLPLKGTGRGLWGKSSTRTMRSLRDEWNR